MDCLDFGHGFLPRVELGNYRALERALGPQSLFDPEPVSVPWVILDGSWVTTNRDILPMRRSAGTRYLIDTSAWRFQSDSAFDVARLANLPHAPRSTWGALSIDDFRRFVADDLRFQASLGAAAYLVPGLIPADRSADLSSYDRATSSVVEQVCFEQPLPVIATVGFHTRGLEVVQHRLESLSSIYSAVYLQPTPIDPYRDSPDKLGNVVMLLQQIQRQGRDAIAGRMGSLTVLLRALGIAAADAGMAAGEAFALNAKLRPQTPSDGSESSTPRASNASRRYLPAIKRSVSPIVVERVESTPAADALLRCTTCCRLLAPNDQIRRGREHSLFARVTEAQQVSSLPGSMRPDHAEREWQAARRTATSVNTALCEAGFAELPTEHLDNQLAVLRQRASRGEAA